MRKTYFILITLVIIFFSAFAQKKLNHFVFFDDDCEVYPVVFSEGFNTDSTSESCWIVTDLDPVGTISNLTWNLNSTWPVIEGNQSAKLQGYWNTASSNDWLISPQVSTDGSQQVRFRYVGSSSPDADSNFKVLISTTGSTNPEDFIELETIDLITPSGWPTVSVEKIIPLAGYTGNIRIAFHVPFESSWNCDSNNYCMWPWELNIDDFHIENIPNCSIPTGLTIENITNTSAEISWTPGYQESQWEVVVVEASAPIENINPDDIVLVNNPEYLAENLEEGTQYKFFVRAFCDELTQSEWIASETFYTDSCADEDKCLYKIHFTGQTYGSSLQIIQNDIVIDQVTPINNQSSFEIMICNNTPLKFQWTSSFWSNYLSSAIIYDPNYEILFEWNSGNESGIIMYETNEGFDCQPQVTCFKPLNLIVNEVTTTSVELQWEEMGSATSWEILVLPQNDPIPDNPTTIHTADSSPFTIDNLESGTAYSFYIRAVCSATDSSNWSFEAQANTLIENDDCEDALELQVSQNFYCENPRKATLATATQSPQSLDCGNAVANDDVWFKFTATAEAHVIYINNVMGESGNILNISNDISLNKVLYSGNCENLQQIFCAEGSTWPLNTQINGNIQNADNDMLIENLVVGQEYYLRVYSNFTTVNKIDFDICITIPEKSIYVSDSQYTVEELITQVLMGGSCSSISNLTYSTGITYGAEHNGIGYFEKSESTFPFENGIVLSTGKAIMATGHKTSINSYTYVIDNQIAWPGDQELYDYAQDLGFDENLESYYNATVIEFDFVGSDDSMSFEFLFSSEDYGKFQCEWSDAFAFFLTDSNGNTQNLALLPDTNTPISVTTVRNAQYNYPNMASCVSNNEEYYANLTDGFMGNSRYSCNNNFMGNTIPLTAYSEITPGETYHIKLVIADRNDGNFDSAVFIKGGSFNFNPSLDLGEDLTIENNKALCPGETYLLESPMINVGYTYQWSKDGTIILNENNSSIEITETGNYSLNITFPGGSCHVEDTTRIEFYEDFRPELNNPDKIELCVYNNISNIVDLSETIEEIMISIENQEEFTFHFFESEEHAITNSNPILNPTTYEVVQFPTTLYVRIENKITGCLGFSSFEIDKKPELILKDPENIMVCQYDGVPQPLDLTIIENEIRNQTDKNIVISFYESEQNAWSSISPITNINNFQPDTLPFIIYIGIINLETNCLSVLSFSIFESENIELIDVEDITICTSYMLPNLPQDYYYSTEKYGQGEILSAGDILSVGEHHLFLNIQNSMGCVFSADTKITVKDCSVQKGISPNGDGLNDYLDLSLYEVISLSIFNRHGKQVYSHGKGYINQWTGQDYNGNNLPEGTYYYKIDTPFEVLSGYIYLSREIR